MRYTQYFCYRVPSEDTAPARLMIKNRSLSLILTVRECPWSQCSVNRTMTSASDLGSTTDYNQFSKLSSFVSDRPFAKNVTSKVWQNFHASVENYLQTLFVNGTSTTHSLTCQALLVHLRGIYYYGTYYYALAKRKSDRKILIDPYLQQHIL